MGTGPVAPAAAPPAASVSLLTRATSSLVGSCWSRASMWSRVNTLCVGAIVRAHREGRRGSIERTMSQQHYVP